MILGRMSKDKKSSEKIEFNEKTRVQVPALVHLTRLGYEYIGKIKEESEGTKYDGRTNILLEVFKEQFKKLNPDHAGEVDDVLRSIRQELDNDDLGKSFYNRLISVSPTKLIDFENIDNNTFHCTGEFTYKNGQEEFRPDITLFVNGLPLVFIEVKKPNNKEGIIAELDRMNNERIPNKKFRSFMNITQLMIFSNNMEYDDSDGLNPVQGAFYCTGARDTAKFNRFREENPSHADIAPFIQEFPYSYKNAEIEKRIITDFNCEVIHGTPEYITNLDSNSPTNRIITSMCSKERLLFFLKYGFAYVKIDKEVDGKIVNIDQKHIMRYQQFFAMLAVRQKLKEGIKSGVIWHTQGSGKTALSYHLTRVLTDDYAKQNRVAKFYFIVDRLDLLEQASSEFEARGLEVKTASTRKELMEQFRKNQSQDGNSGRTEITVVNIQKFAEDEEKVELNDYATNLQRVFIIDEAHRGYNPKGCFLANLFEADQKSVKIALTGTPLLKEERASWKVFGNYLHIYYYDKSIQDGYTVKIMREDIETSYRGQILDIYENHVQKKDIPKKNIIEHETYVKALLRYVISDFKKFRIRYNDDTLGGMVICETSGQAKKLFECFDGIQKELNKNESEKKELKVGLILHDTDDKETRKRMINDFKKNNSVDILIVYNMLLTGFDAPRLKRLYFGRKLKDHNLLQALTRVNRPYKDIEFGYVVDFANIKKNFDETNKAYIEELSKFNDPTETGDGIGMDAMNQIFVTQGEIEAKLQEIKQVLFSYPTNNLEKFCSEISGIKDKKILFQLKSALTSARSLYNIVRTVGDEESKQKFKELEIGVFPLMLSEVSRRIDSINLKEALEGSNRTKQLINEAMKNISFTFKLKDESELKVISGGIELEEKKYKVVNMFIENFDKDDPKYITLAEAFRQVLKGCGFVIDSLEEYNKILEKLDRIIKGLDELKRGDNTILSKYEDDEKFARIHKRLKEENERRKNQSQKPIISESEQNLFDVLIEIKGRIDDQVYNRSDILNNDKYFQDTVMKAITDVVKNSNYLVSREDKLFIQEKLIEEYMDQYKKHELSA